MKLITMTEMSSKLLMDGIPEGEEENARVLKSYILVIKDDLDAHALAYKIFKSALYIRPIHLYSHEAENVHFYQVEVTYPSHEEKYYLATYGDNFNDYNDY